MMYRFFTPLVAVLLVFIASPVTAETVTPDKEQKTITFFLPDEEKDRPIAYQLIKLARTEKGKELIELRDSVEFKEKVDCWLDEKCPENKDYFTDLLNEYDDTLSQYRAIKRGKKVDFGISNRKVNTTFLTDPPSKDTRCTDIFSAFLLRDIELYKITTVLNTLELIRRQLMLSDSKNEKVLNAILQDKAFFSQLLREQKLVLSQLVQTGLYTLTYIRNYKHLIAKVAEQDPGLLKKHYHQIDKTLSDESTALSDVHALIENELKTTKFSYTLFNCPQIVPHFLDPNTYKTRIYEMRDKTIEIRNSDMLPGEKTAAFRTWYETWTNKNIPGKETFENWESQGWDREEALKFIEDNPNAVGQLLLLATAATVNLLILAESKDSAELRAQRLALKAFYEDISLNNMKAFLQTAPKILYDPSTEKPYQWDLDKKEIFYYLPGTDSSHRVSVPYIGK